MAGLVGIEVRLLGQQGQQLRGGLGEGLRGFLIQFGQVTDLKDKPGAPTLRA
jgi:hypothetical protein